MYWVFLQLDVKLVLEKVIVRIEQEKVPVVMQVERMVCKQHLANLCIKFRWQKLQLDG